MGIKHTTQTAKSDDPTYDVSADEWNEKHTTASGSATIVAGLPAYVDVTHGLGYTPTIDKIHLTPQDNLDGRSFWPSNAGATTFRINISGMDITASHVFSWIIV